MMLDHLGLNVMYLCFEMSFQMIWVTNGTSAAYQGWDNTELRLVHKSKGGYFINLFPGRGNINKVSGVATRCMEKRGRRRQSPCYFKKRDPYYDPYNIELNRYKESEGGNIQPQVSAKGKLCVVVVASVLANPHWVTVACNRPLLPDVACHKHASNNSDIVSSHRKKNFCPNDMIWFRQVCYLFVFFYGQTKRKNNALCAENKTKLQNNRISDPKCWEFLYQAAETGLPPLLSFSSKQEGMLEVFSFFRIFNRIDNFRKQTNTSSGLYSCKTYFTAPVQKQLSFECVDGQSISTHFVCDGQHDCKTENPEIIGSDEAACVCRKSGNCSCSPLFYEDINGTCSSYSRAKSHAPTQTEIQFNCSDGSVIDISLVNDLIPDCPNGEDETNHQTALRRSHLSANNLMQDQIQCEKGSTVLYHSSRICIFRLNGRGHLTPCRTGSHLKDCKNFQCNKEFKCPNHYCIPWIYVCDNKIDCPAGNDEISSMCETYTCKELFHCHQSQLCVSLGDICDGFEDCPLRDDEFSCQLNDIHCYQHCTCFLLAILCSSEEFNVKNFLSLPFVAYHLTEVKLSSAGFLQKQAGDIVMVNISMNSIDDICECLHEAEHILLLDVSSNSVNVLVKNCFSDHDNLSQVILKNNSMTDTEGKAFNNLSKLSLVDLSNNLLTRLSKSVFHNVKNRFSIFLQNNHLSVVHQSAIYNSIPIVLSSDFPQICCIVSSETTCIAPRPWFHQCFTLLPDLPTEIVVHLVVVILISFHSVVLFLHHTGDDVKQEKDKNSFNYLLAATGMNDCLYAVFLTVLTAAHFFFKTERVFKYLEWTDSIVCKFGFALAAFFSLFSPLILSLIALGRLMVVLHPLDSNFKVREKVRKYVFAVFLSTSMMLGSFLSCTFVLDVKLNTFCFPVILDEISWFKIVSSIFIACVQVVVPLFILTAYTLLVKELYKAPDIASSKKKRKYPVVIQVSILTGSCFLSWVSSNIIFLASVFTLTDPYKLLSWTLILVYPANCVVSQFVLNFHAFSSTGNKQKPKTVPIANPSLRKKGSFVVP